MGSSRSDIDSGLAAANEGPQHRAVIKQPIAVGRFEVTRDQYAAFVKSSGYKAGDRCFTFEHNVPQERDQRSFLNPGFVQDGNHPAVCVSWTDAKAYVAMAVANHRQALPAACPKPNSNMPRAREAIRASALATIPPISANSPMAPINRRKTAGLPADAAYMNCQDGYPFTAPVGSLSRPNAFGLHDLIGNVWEWTEDCFYGDYATASLDGAARDDAACTSRTVRGGDWFSTEALVAPGRSRQGQCRSAPRRHRLPGGADAWALRI